MRAFTHRRFWMILRYRLGVLSVCLAYLLTALEIPLPIFAHKNSTQPFPCQNHPCGCQTAEQCWSHCCCFTAEERWAWARAHDVEPPAYAERPRNHGWNTVKRRDQDSASATQSCCRAHQEAALPSDGRSKSNGSWATTIAVQRCQGYSVLWISAGAVLPASPPAAWSPEDTPPAQVCFSPIRAAMIPFTPPDPPPRFSHA